MIDPRAVGICAGCKKAVLMSDYRMWTQGELWHTSCAIEAVVRKSERGKNEGRPTNSV